MFPTTATVVVVVVVMCVIVSGIVQIRLFKDDDEIYLRECMLCEVSSTVEVMSMQE